MFLCILLTDYVIGGLRRNYRRHQCREDMDLPMLDLSSIIKATNNFSVNNKLGEGGFGPVYKVFGIKIHLSLS